MANELNELKELIKKRAELESDIAQAVINHREWLSDSNMVLMGLLRSIADLVESNEATLRTNPTRRTKKKPPEPDHDRIAKQYADFEPAASGCLCGCGEDVPEGTNFVKGHHRKLQSIAGAVGAGKLPRVKMSDAGVTYALAHGWVESD